MYWKGWCGLFGDETSQFLCTGLAVNPGAVKKCVQPLSLVCVCVCVCFSVLNYNDVWIRKSTDQPTSNMQYFHVHPHIAFITSSARGFHLRIDVASIQQNIQDWLWVATSSSIDRGLGWDATMFVLYAMIHNELCLIHMPEISYILCTSSTAQGGGGSFRIGNL